MDRKDQVSEVNTPGAYDLAFPTKHAFGNLPLECWCFSPA